MKRWTCLLALCASACTAPPQPLLAPLAANLALPSGVRLAVLDADLPALAETTRLAAGKVVAVAGPEWAIPDAPAGHFKPFAAGVPLQKVSLAWHDAKSLRVTAQWGKVAVALSAVQNGQADCGLAWDAQGATTQFDVQIVREADDTLAVHAVKSAATVWQNAAVSDPSACLSALPAGVPQSLPAYLETTLADGLASHLEDAARATLATVFSATLEQSGRVQVQFAADPAVEARFALRYQEDSGAIVNHAGALAQANVAVSLDVDRHPCAVEAPLPTAVVTTLAQRPPPTGQAFLRRALVLDNALVQRLAWMAARSGALCAQARGGLATTLSPGWAADLLPQVDEWIEGPPTGARFWPGSSPTTQLVDTPAGAGIEWTMDDGQLEIIARVADTEMVVLTVTGGFRATLLPRLQGPRTLGFELVSVERLSTHQSSPLLGDLATPASESALSALCEAALQGIFADQAVLPLLPLSAGPLPAGTVLTGVDRTGDALWLWLEGGETQ